MSSQNWWASKLTGTPSTPTYSPPPVQQPNRIPAGQNNTPPVVASPTERCPGCGSNNYGGATPEARKRCYDCGYPIVQSGSGMGRGISGGPRPEGAVEATKQIPTGGFRPDIIIGKLE